MTFVDIDAEIVKTEGRAVEDVFQNDGEAYFRKVERDRLSITCMSDRQVISTGGGMVTNQDNCDMMSEAGVVVCLEASPETLHGRLQAQQKDGRRAEIRPLLIATDPLHRIRQLKADRQHWYATADWIVQTDHLDIEGVVEEVMRCWSRLSAQRDSSADPTLSSVVRVSSGDYPVWVGWGIMDDLGARAVDTVSPNSAYVITDTGAFPHGRAAQRSMEAAGIPTHILQVPAGEVSKNLDIVRLLYAWLAQLRAQRSDLIVAVGGGVVGDLAGFVAATFLRGIPFVQVPTTMLAMMDSSIGGKTGVDLPEGKNLVGAFYQPRFVLADVSTLNTLPERELISGWAEAIKHGLILDEPLLSTFEGQAGKIKALDEEVATDVIRRSVAVKAGVVSRDERETLGIRMLLNYGHTIGHAIEAATGYERFLHGEAVSIGMMGAADISRNMGLLSDDAVDRQRGILESFGLP